MEMARKLMEVNMEGTRLLPHPLLRNQFNLQICIQCPSDGEIRQTRPFLRLGH